MVIHRDEFATAVSNACNVGYGNVCKVFEVMDDIAREYLGMANEDREVQLEVLDGFYFMSKYRSMFSEKGYRLKPCIELYSAVSRKTNNNITQFAREYNKQT